jgi:hypothetical protein
MDSQTRKGMRKKKKKREKKKPCVALSHIQKQARALKFRR